MKELFLQLQEWGGRGTYLKQIVDSEYKIKAADQIGMEAQSRLCG